MLEDSEAVNPGALDSAAQEVSCLATPIQMKFFRTLVFAELRRFGFICGHPRVSASSLHNR